jgi:hypothetical protein
VADRLVPAHGAGLASQGEEGGLEGVLGVLHVAEHAPADAEHHRPVTADQFCEGVLVAAGAEAFQQLPVRLALSGRRAGQPVQVTDDRVELCTGHAAFSRAGVICRRMPREEGGAATVFPHSVRGAGGTGGTPVL